MFNCPALQARSPQSCASLTQALILKAGKIIGDRFCKVHLLKTGIGVGVRKYLNLSSTNFEYYAVECEEMTQGMIFLETDFHKSRNGKNLAYVDFLAIAPWNRQEIARNPKYRGTGSLLMYLAVSRSEQLGYKYRTGLHSLPAARTFYGKLGMRDLGPDPNYQNLHYFEFDEGTGKAFIRR